MKEHVTATQDNKKKKRVKQLKGQEPELDLDDYVDVHVRAHDLDESLDPKHGDGGGVSSNALELKPWEKADRAPMVLGAPLQRRISQHHREEEDRRNPEEKLAREQRLNLLIETKPVVSLPWYAPKPWDKPSQATGAQTPSSQAPSSQQRTALPQPPSPMHNRGGGGDAQAWQQQQGGPQAWQGQGQQQAWQQQGQQLAWQQQGQQQAWQQQGQQQAWQQPGGGGQQWR